MKIHIVQKGDTLWEIAKKYDVDFEELKQLNTQFSNPDMIMPGMKVKIPSSTKTVKKETQMKETQKPKVEHPFKEMAPKPLPVMYEDDHKKPKEVKLEMPKKPSMPEMPIKHPESSHMPEMPIKHPESSHMPEMPIKHPESSHMPQQNTLNIPPMPQYIPPMEVIQPQEQTMPAITQPLIQILPVCCCCQQMMHSCGQGMHGGMEYMHSGYEMPYHQPIHHTQMNFQPEPFGHMNYDFPSPYAEMPKHPVYQQVYNYDCGCPEHEHPMSFSQPPYGMENMQQGYHPSYPEFHTRDQTDQVYPLYTEEVLQDPTPPGYPDFSGINEREETDGE